MADSIRQRGPMDTTSRISITALVNGKSPPTSVPTDSGVKSDERNERNERYEPNEKPACVEAHGMSNQKHVGEVHERSKDLDLEAIEKEQHDTNNQSKRSKRSESVSCKTAVVASNVKPLNVTSWSPEEDEKLVQLVEKYGPRAWSTISRVYFNNERTATQLRSRYADVLHPDRNREPWTPEEDKRLIEVHSEIGNRWSALAKEMPGRVSNDVKNRVRYLLKKQRTENQGKQEKHEKQQIVALNDSTVGSTTRNAESN